jgi:hypothetical protein
MSSVVLHSKIDTPQCCDCVAFNPTRPNLLIVGTYSLNASTNTRLGSLILYSVQHTADNTSCSTLSHLDVAGVFECSWVDDAVVVLALADGCMALVSINGHDEGKIVSNVASIHSG